MIFEEYKKCFIFGFHFQAEVYKDLPGNKSTVAPLSISNDIVANLHATSASRSASIGGGGHLPLATDDEDPLYNVISIENGK